MEKHLTGALAATIIDKSLPGVHNTIKAMINHLEEEDWAEYLEGRLAVLLTEPTGE